MNRKEPDRIKLVKNRKSRSSINFHINQTIAVHINENISRRTLSLEMAKIFGYH